MSRGLVCSRCMGCVSSCKGSVPCSDFVRARCADCVRYVCTDPDRSRGVCSCVASWVWVYAADAACEYVKVGDWVPVRQGGQDGR